MDLYSIHKSNYKINLIFIFNNNQDKFKLKQCLCQGKQKIHLKDNQLLLAKVIIINKKKINKPKFRINYD